MPKYICYAEGIVVVEEIIQAKNKKEAEKKFKKQANYEVDYIDNSTLTTERIRKEDEELYA